MTTVEETPQGPHCPTCNRVRPIVNGYWVCQRCDTLTPVDPPS